MSKCALLVHNSEKDSLLEKLQDEAIMHLSDLKESTLAKKHSDLVSAEEKRPKELEEAISGLSSAIAYLEKHAEKKGLLEGLFGSKIVLDEDDFKRLGAGDSASIIAECERLDAKERDLRQRESHLRTQLDILSPWESLDVPFEELKSTARVTLIAGVVPNHIPRTAVDEAAGDDLHIEVIHEGPQGTYCIALYLNAAEEKVQPLLKEIEFDPVDLAKFRGKPEEILTATEGELRQIEGMREELQSTSSRIAGELQKVYILHDYSLSLLEQRLAQDYSLNTRETLYLEGWVRTGDYKKLEEITTQFSTVSLMIASAPSSS